jgi:cobyrinic acid a,c-diamide synthase
MLRQVCDDLGITCFGYLPKQAALEQGSRYLGLDFSKEAESDELVNLLQAHVDWKEILKPSVSLGETDGSSTGNRWFPQEKLRVLIARNSESFTFLYQETLDTFASTSFFDPESEVPDLSDVDLLYLPGGYPEKHLEALVANEACRKAIKDFAERGGRVVAECGGMMYLCQTIVTDEGAYPMCGVLPYSITARQTDRKLSLGYRRFMLDGKEYRGHEFHYTQFLGEKPQSVTQVYNAKGEPVETPVFRYKNVLASYTHLYQL